MNRSTVPETKLDRFAAIFLACVCAISLLAVTGWLFNRPILASLNPQFIPMAPASALIFLGLCGAWLTQRVFPARGGVRIFVQAGLVGLLILVLILGLRYFTGLGPDLEKILYAAPPLFGQFSSARMSPLSALGFLLAIPAFLLLSGGKPGQRTKSTAAALALALFILSGLIILGYLFGAPLFYGGTLIPMAVTSALSFGFLSLGLLMTAGSTCWPVRLYVGHSLRARLMRAFVPASLLIVLIQGFLSTAADPWIINPAVRIAVAALVGFLIVFLIISLLANNLSADFERSDRARLQAENTLKQSEARFRTLAETANDAIINIDRDGHIVFWNRAAESMFGYSADEVNGKPLDMVMPDGFRTAHQHGLQRVVLTGETHLMGTTVEVSGLRKDGREFPLTLSLATWQVAGEVFFTGIAHDITERKRGEEAVRKSASSLQAVLQSTADGILAVGSENEVLYANERFAKLWRIPQAVIASNDDSVLLQHVLDQLSDPQSFLKKVQELYKSKEENFDILDFKDGRVFERHSRPLMQGEVVRGRVWSFRDITEDKRTTEALAKSEAELRALFAGMTDVVIVYDIDGRYIEIAPTNPANLYRLPDEMLGKKVQDILPKEQADYIVTKIRESIQTDQVVHGEYSLQIDGKETWFSASASRLSETTAVWVAHDISLRKRAEQDLFKLSMAVDDSSEAIFMTDREGLITFVNSGFTNLYGYSADEIVGKTTPRILKSGMMKPENYATFWQTLLNKQVIKGELINKTKDGRLLNIDGSANPILNQQEEIIGFLGIQHDITEHKRFELVQNVIFRITQAAITSEGIDALYKSIHSILGELIPAENFYIALIDPASNLISFPYYVDQFDEPPSGQTQIQGLTGYVIHTGRPLLATREILDRLVAQGEVEAVGTVGVDWMGAPLRVEGRMIGVMAVQSYKEGIHFT
ncbi:MAG TPA: PAS domain S-box protein, partial [Anaerolineales bacterium]